MKRVMVWFRNNLRIEDNEPLYKACKNACEVIPVYCFDASLKENNEISMPRVGAVRLEFLYESVYALKKQLVNLGSDLLIVEGSTEEKLLQLAEKWQVDSIYTQQEAGYEEEMLENKLEKRLWKMGVPLEKFWQQTLYHIEDLPFTIQNIPLVFTDFRKEVESSVSVRQVFEAPDKIHSPSLRVNTNVANGSGEIGELTKKSKQQIKLFAGGEIAGKERIANYIWKEDRLHKYKDTRNELLGLNYSSKFSPWLALGCLSPRTIYKEVKKYENDRIKNDSTYWLVFELIWRDYFKFISRKFGSSLFLPGGIKGVGLDYQEDIEAFDKWIKGQTGVPFVDANMRELAATGYMSNRGRQNVASFLVHDLNVKWTWGAMWFETMLVDYDPGSNWGNWNYIAGIGNDPRPNRKFNVLSQAKRYDGKGNFVRHWVDELAKIPDGRIHDPFTLDKSTLKQFGVRPGKNYPLPIVEFP
ncbi:MAG: DASH family cryptochrome [Cyclobacteriaceae bacterium]